MMSTRFGQDIPLRPLPWRRMAWVVWRQHRLTLAGVVVVLGVAALVVLLLGVQMHQAYTEVAGFHSASAEARQNATDQMMSQYASKAHVMAAMLQAVPGLIGAFVGGPLLASEFETGTFRYAWTQGFGRARWITAKLVSLAVLVTISAFAFSQLFSWAYQPIIGGADGFSPLNPTMFDLRGVTLASWTLASFAIGALAGMLIRRVIPAMFATLATWVGLAFATGLYLRNHYAAPVVTRNPDVGSSAWVLTQQWTKDGHPVSLSTLNQTLHQIGTHAVTLQVWEPIGLNSNVDPVHYLIQRGFTQLTTYQPASRFWLFQGIEGGWLLALSVVLLVTVVSLVRRRAV